MTLLASALMRSAESATEPLVWGCGDPLGSPTVPEIAVALERGLPSEVAVGPRQQAFGESGSDVTLGEGAVFGLEGALFFWLPVQWCFRLGLCLA